MATESSASEQSGLDVEEVAERRGLGEFRQMLVPRKRRLLRGSGGKAKGFLHEFENGVVYQDGDDDGHMLAFSWDEVAGVYVGSTRKYVNGTYGGTEYVCTAMLGNGGRLALSGWFRDPALGRVPAGHEDDEYEIFLLMSAAAMTVSRTQLPDAVARLERGEGITFGEMVISKFGVRTADRQVPWGTLTEVRVKEGIIQFKQSGKFFELSRWSLHQVPNLPLFFMLVDTFRPGAVQG